MVEYALLVALVALIAIPAVRGLGGSVRAEYNRAADQVAGAGSFQPTPVPCNSNHPNWPFCT